MMVLHSHQCTMYYIYSHNYGLQYLKWRTKPEKAAFAELSITQSITHQKQNLKTNTYVKYVTLQNAACLAAPSYNPLVDKICPLVTSLCCFHLFWDPAFPPAWNWLQFPFLSSLPLSWLNHTVQNHLHHRTPAFSCPVKLKATNWAKKKTVYKTRRRNVWKIASFSTIPHKLGTV